MPYLLGGVPPFLEGLLSPGQLSSPDQVFTPVASTPTSVPAFDFSATSGGEECPSGFAEPSATGLPQAVLEPGNISSMEEAPSSTLSLLGKGPSFGYVIFPAGYEPALRREGLGGSSKDFVCTPPYTPHQGSSFLFGAQEPPAPSAAPAASPPATDAPSTAGATVPATTTAPTPTTSPELYTQEQRSALYEKLPPTPDSPGNGDCTVMNVPEIRGPLFIDVPVVPEGILTPEASPIKQTFFRYSEREKSEIERLAQQISSLAEAFSAVASRDPAKDEPMPGTMPGTCLDFQPPKAWRSVDFSLLTCPEEDLLEEGALETLLQDLSASLFERGGAGSRCPHHQFCGGSASSPLGLDPEESSQEALAASPSTDLPPEDRCFLEELACYETAFETRASNSPCDGLDELYQLPSHAQDGFHEGTFTGAEPLDLSEERVGPLQTTNRRLGRKLGGGRRPSMCPGASESAQSHV